MQTTRLLLPLAMSGVLTAALLGSACDEKKPTPAKPTASTSARPTKASSSASAAASARKPSFEELVKKSKPLAPKPTSVEVEGAKIEAMLCTLEGGPLLHKSNMDVIRSLEVIKETLYLVDFEGAIRAFKIDSADGCKLSVDKSFGKDGKLKLGRGVRVLSKDTKGNLVASGGGFSSFRLKDGEQQLKCDQTRMSYVQLHPSGTWGLATFANATVKKVTFSDKECKAEDWALQDLSKPTRKGPFTNVNSVGFVGNLVLVGGIQAEKVDRREPRVVVAFDAKGKEKFRFGSTEKVVKDDGFGWIHAIGPCKPGICVLDSNFRRLTMWKKTGKFIGKVDLAKLLDLKYAWVPDFAMAEKGVAYFPAGQTRGAKSGVAEGNIYRVSGL